MEDSNPITPELREDLVAYLDGELDEVATLDIERSLSESAEIRQEVESLSRTWDLLEALPEVRSSSQFTERTMASLPASDLPQRAQPLLSPVAKRNVTLASLVAGVLLCAGLGFVFANRIPAQSDPLIEDLPVIENLDLYQEVGEAAFLVELKEMGGLITEQPGENYNDNN